MDPINIAAHIYLSLQELTAREISAKKPAVVTVGRFQGGQAPNIIPEEAVLEGTIRTFDRELSARIMERIRVIAENTAAAFRGSAQVEGAGASEGRDPLWPRPARGRDAAEARGLGGGAGWQGAGVPSGSGRHGLRGLRLLHL